MTCGFRHPGCIVTVYSREPNYNGKEFGGTDLACSRMEEWGGKTCSKEFILQQNKPNQFILQQNKPICNLIPTFTRLQNCSHLSSLSGSFPRLRPAFHSMVKRERAWYVHVVHHIFIPRQGTCKQG